MEGLNQPENPPEPRPEFPQKTRFKIKFNNAMNTFPYSVCAAILACSIAHGQTTATTNPVGYVTIDMPAQSDTTITPPLAKTPILNSISTDISGNIITCSATGAADNSFINTSPNSNSKCYLLVKSGPLVGLRFPVTGNTATTITVDGGASTLQSQGFLTDVSFSVIPYWTLGTLFPGGNGVGASQDIYDPQAFLYISDQAGVGLNRATSKAYFYNDGTDGNPAGWRDADTPEGDIQDTVPIDPSITYTIRTGTSPQSLTVTGEVPSSDIATKILVSPVTGNDEYLSSPYPVDITLAESGLQSVIVPSSDIYDPSEFVFTFNESAQGLNKGASGAYFYHDGTDGYPAGWRDASDPEGALVTNKVLKAGRCFVLRKAMGASNSLKWTAPLPYSVQ